MLFKQKVIKQHGCCAVSIVVSNTTKTYNELREQDYMNTVSTRWCECRKCKKGVVISQHPPNPTFARPSLGMIWKEIDGTRKSVESATTGAYSYYVHAKLHSSALWQT
jgi:hypothetical protein